MKHIKLFENFNHSEFITWLSVKLDKKIGKCIGHGFFGDVYELDTKRVIKITNDNVMQTYSLMNKKIDGIANIYNVGKIIVPKRYILDDMLFFDDIEIPLVGNEVGYIIMEKITLENQMIEDIYKLYNDYNFQIEVMYIHGIDYLELYKEKLNDESFSPLLDKIGELLSKLRPNFKWRDIHIGQLGVNIKGDLVAFDLDGSKFVNDYSLKTVIKETFCVIY